MASAFIRERGDRLRTGAARCGHRAAKSLREHLLDPAAPLRRDGAPKRASPRSNRVRSPSPSWPRAETNNERGVAYIGLARPSESLRCTATSRSTTATACRKTEPRLRRGFLAASMLASTLGIEFDPDGAWNERKRVYETSNLIVGSTSITAYAQGDELGRRPAPWLRRCFASREGGPAQRPFTRHQLGQEWRSGHVGRQPCGAEHGVEIVSCVVPVVRAREARGECFEEGRPARLVAHLQAVDEHEQAARLQDARDLGRHLPTHIRRQSKRKVVVTMSAMASASGIFSAAASISSAARRPRSWRAPC